MKNRDIRAASKEDLNNKMDELRKDLIKLRMQIATGTALKSPGLVKKSKKDIARILTELNKKIPAQKENIKITKTSKKEDKKSK
ncbi:MAG: 50S ribosomal protein L29 [Nanoarchaeota archaeon]|nr:50S ribosomal protein L29 [Nanoarchaeota archaeon]